jgi:hypothetical protein
MPEPTSVAGSLFYAVATSTASVVNSSWDLVFGIGGFLIALLFALAMLRAFTRGGRRMFR